MEKVSRVVKKLYTFHEIYEVYDYKVNIYDPENHEVGLFAVYKTRF